MAMGFDGWEVRQSLGAKFCSHVHECGWKYGGVVILKRPFANVIIQGGWGNFSESAAAAAAICGGRFLPRSHGTGRLANKWERRSPVPFAFAKVGTVGAIILIFI